MTSSDEFLAIVDPEAVERVDSKAVRELLSQFRVHETDDDRKARDVEFLDTVVG